MGIMLIHFFMWHGGEVGNMKNDYEIKDSGKHRDFDTGAKRDDKVGKGRFDCGNLEF